MNRSRTSLRKFFTVIIAAVVLLTSLTAIYSPDIHAADQSVVRVKLSIGSVTQLDFKLNGNYGIKGADRNLSPGSYSVI